MNEKELRNLMYTAQLPNKGPFSIRYPRGNSMGSNLDFPFEEIPVGKAEKIKDGQEIAILSIGHPGNFVVDAEKEFNKQGLDIAHYNMRFVKPLDEEALHKISTKFNHIITIEDGCLQGGFGSAILEFIANNKYKVSVKMLGIPDVFIQQGTQEELRSYCGYNTKAIISAVHSILKKSKISQAV